MSKQISYHNGKIYICERCLNHFQKKETLDKHLEYCIKKDVVRIDLSREGSQISFQNFHKQQMHPFTIYADMKSVLGNKYEKRGSKTRKIMSIKSQAMVFTLNRFMKIYIRQENVVNEIDSILTKEMIYILNDKRKFDRATKSWICNEPFTKQDKKVRDHCQFYR